MLEIPGYLLTEVVYQDPHILVGYAVSEKTRKTMLLKAVKSGERTIIENAKLIHEYNFLSGLKMDGILKPTSYITFKNRIVLDYEPIHGLTLREYFSKRLCPVSLYGPILLRTVRRLRELHERQILHLNIRPDTLLIQHNTIRYF